MLALKCLNSTSDFILNMDLQAYPQEPLSHCKTKKTRDGAGMNRTECGRDNETKRKSFMYIWPSTLAGKVGLQKWMICEPHKSSKCG